MFYYTPEAQDYHRPWVRMERVNHSQYLKHDRASEIFGVVTQFAVHTFQRRGSTLIIRGHMGFLLAR